MQMALIGVFTALDGLLFYLFWEIALIPIYFICLIWGGEDRGRITLKFFIYTLAGSLFMLVGLVYLYYQTPSPHTFDIQCPLPGGQSFAGSNTRIDILGDVCCIRHKDACIPFSYLATRYLYRCARTGNYVVIRHHA